MLEIRSNIKALTRFLFSIPLLFAVVACSQLTSVNCDPHSWHGQGIRDGLRGTAPSAANEYERTCSRESTAFDRQAYLTGLKQGNAEYCTGQNGFDLALSGIEFRRVCANEYAVSFKDGLKSGRKLRKAVLNLDSSNVSPKLVRGGFTVLQGYSDLIHQAWQNTHGDMQNVEIAITSRYPIDRDERIPHAGRKNDRVSKCEDAKRKAEQKGFYTRLKCS